MKKNKRGDMRGRCREKESKLRGGAAECRFRVRKLSIYTCFFLSGGLVEPVRFGSVSDFGNRNRIEPELFCDFLIG